MRLLGGALAICFVLLAVWQLSLPATHEQSLLRTSCLSGGDCLDKAKILRMIDNLSSQLQRRIPAAPLAERGPPPTFIRAPRRDTLPVDGSRHVYRTHNGYTRYVYHLRGPAPSRGARVVMPPPSGPAPEHRVVHVYGSKDTARRSAMDLHVRYNHPGNGPSPIEVPMPWRRITTDGDSQPFTVNIVRATFPPTSSPTEQPVLLTDVPTDTPSMVPTHPGLPRFPPVQRWTRSPRVPKDCVVGKWGPWTECSATCGRGLKMRRRNILREPDDGGAACPKTEDSDYCNIDPCPCVRQTAGGELCVFPFFWNGRNQWDCVEYDAALRLWWCPTVKEFKDPFPGHPHVEGGYPARPSFPGLNHKEWDWCETGCVELNQTEVERLTKEHIPMTNFAP